MQPIVTAITSLSYDHTHLLGETLAEIAAEKAGIIKPGIPIISAPQKPEAERVLQQIASNHGAPLEIIGSDWLYEIQERTETNQRFRIWPVADRSGRSATSLQVGLLGDHQVENAAVAYVVLKRAGSRGFEVPPEALRAGFSQVQWQGRFQILKRDPTLIVDSAHNGDSARRLQAALDQYFPGRSIHLIFGASEDKDIRLMLKNLAPSIDRATMTQASHPRAADPNHLLEVGREFIEDLDSVVPIQDAVREALGRADKRDVVLVTGSLFTVGELLASWQQGPDSKLKFSPGEAA